MKRSFNEVYNEMYRENYEELEVLRKQSKKVVVKVIAIILLVIVACIIFPKYEGIILLGSIFLLIFYLIIASKKNPELGKPTGYREVFKEKVIAPLISNVFEEASFNPLQGISRYEYKEAGYKDDIDRYYSEDLVTAKIIGNDGVKVNIKFAEVHTESEHTDSDGDRTYTTEFRGLAGQVDLNKNINNEIYIRKNWSVSSFNKNKIKMDMSEFEKIFDVEGTDKILTLRILTSEIMTEMIDLYNKYKYRFEIHIINNKIYMRIATGAVFEPNIFKKAIDYKTVERYYLILQAAMNISKHIYDTVNEIEL